MELTTVSLLWESLVSSFIAGTKTVEHVVPNARDRGWKPTAGDLADVRPSWDARRSRVRVDQLPLLLLLSGPSPRPLPFGASRGLGYFYSPSTTSMISSATMPVASR